MRWATCVSLPTRSCPSNLRTPRSPWRSAWTTCSAARGYGSQRPGRSWWQRPWPWRVFASSNCGLIRPLLNVFRELLHGDRSKRFDANAAARAEGNRCLHDGSKVGRLEDVDEVITSEARVLVQHPDPHPSQFFID